jgi:hypothetical protein
MLFPFRVGGPWSDPANPLYAIPHCCGIKPAAIERNKFATFITDVEKHRQPRGTALLYRYSGRRQGQTTTAFLVLELSM